MITRAALGIAALAAAWLGLLAGVMVLTDAAPAAFVPFPSPAFFDALPEGAAIVGSNGFSVTLASADPGFAAALYRAGAWIVLPAGLKGCSPI